MFSGHDKVALSEGAISHQDRRHGPTAAIEARFHYRALPRRIFHRGKLEQFRLKQQRLEEGIDPFPGHGGNMHELRIAAPLVRHHFPARELGLHPLGISAFLVHLVDRNHKGDICRPSVSHGLFRLRHHAVVRGHNEDHDIRELGPPRPHSRKGGVTGGIEEGHRAVPRIHVVRPNVLGNAPRLTTGHAGFANIVEERSFTVVDVTHHGHHRCARLALAFDFQGLEVLLLDGIGGHGLCPVTKLLHQEDGRILIEHLVDGGHHPHAHELLNRVPRLNGQPLCQVAHGDRFRHLNVPGHHFRRPLKALGFRHALRRCPALALR